MPMRFRQIPRLTIKLGMTIFLIGVSCYGQLPQVLYINSYHPGRTWSDSLARGIYSGLDNVAEVHTEYLHGKRTDLSEYEDELCSILKLKYTHTPVDVLMVSDDVAFDFIKRHRDDLFPELPVVACGINFMTPEIIGSCPRATGVTEGGDIAATVQLALDMLPQTEQVIFLSSWKFPERIERQIKEVKDVIGDRVAYLHIATTPDTTPEWISDRLVSEKKPSVIIYFSLLVNEGNRMFHKEGILERTLGDVQHPIFAFNERNVTSGAVGGMIEDGEQQGEAAALMVRQILDGRPVSDIKPIYEPIKRPVFNYDVMKEMGISMRSIPKNSYVINQPDNQYARYRRVIAIGSVFTLLQTALLLALNHANRRRKKSEADLIEAKEVAEAASRVKSDFLTVVSHEIRTPMNGIIGFSDLMIDEESQSERNEYIRLIQGSGQRLLRVIDDILEFSKLNNPDVVSENEPCEIENEIGALVDRFVSQANDKGLELIYESHWTNGERPLLNWEHLEIATSKLVENAIKFSKTGTVKVILETKEKNTLSISIIDQGVGISKEALTHIFEPFSQIEKTDTREHEGLGLGLSLSRRLIMAMGGTLRCESEQNKGSKFIISIPFQP